MNKRLDYIDLAKGIAIILVILGHCYSQTNIIIQIIYSFHMPFFFICSGIIYGLREKKKICLNLEKKIRTLIVPYLIMGSGYLLFLGLLSKNGLFSRIESFFFFQGSSMWFLPIFFISVVIFILSGDYKNEICISLGIIGFYISKFGNYPSMHILSRSFIGLLWIYLGWRFAKYIIKRNSITTNICVVIIDSILIALNGTVSLVGLEFNNTILYLLTGLIGSYLLIQIAMAILNKGYNLNLIKAFGKDSIYLLCLHQYLIQIIRVLDYKLLNNLLPKLGLFEGFVFSLIVCGILYFLIPLVNRYLYFVFGKEK